MGFPNFVDEETGELGAVCYLTELREIRRLLEEIKERLNE